MTYIILRDTFGDLETIPGIEFTEFTEEELGDAVYNAVEAIMDSMDSMKNVDEYSNEQILSSSEELAIFRSVDKVGDMMIEEFIKTNAVIDFENYEYNLYLKLKEKFEK